MSIKNYIAAVNDQLTPAERRIAEVILADSALVSFGTVSELAAKVNTSRATIVRFATKLGFDGFAALQQHVRDDVTQVLNSPSQRVRGEKGDVAEMQTSLVDSIHASFASIDEQTLRSFASALATAENIWIVSGETSMAGAHVLHSGLSMIRERVHIADEHSASRKICCANNNDVAVVIDFSRYRRTSVLAARALAELGVQILAVTDGPLSPLALLTKLRLDVKIPAVGPFDSSVPAVIAAELLVAQVVKQREEESRDRIDKLESFWQATDTFLAT